MPQVAILQMTNGEPEVDTSAATYATCVQQWGFPAVHTQLLQELRAWVETVPALRRQPRLAPGASSSTKWYCQPGKGEDRLGQLA